MKNLLATETGSGINWIPRVLRALMAMLIGAGSLITPLASHAAELKNETLAAWDTYLHAANLPIGSQKSFLWVDEQRKRLRHVREGEIVVSSVSQPIPKPVPSGLIHDWIGAEFIPGASVQDVLSTVRDYGNYKQYYRPAVVDSTLLTNAGPCQQYSMRVVNKELVAQTALHMEYETCYIRIDERRWYSTTHTTRVREIRHYGQPDEQELPPNQGSGYIWRLYSVARFEQRDGGTYVEVEAIALSRDLPIGLDWLVTPIVRHVSKNSMALSLQQTREAVRFTEEANNNRKSSTTAGIDSRRAVSSEVAVTDRLAPSMRH